MSQNAIDEIFMSIRESLTLSAAAAILAGELDM